MDNPQGSVNVPAPTSQLYNSNANPKQNVHYDKGAPVNPLQKAGGYSAQKLSCADTSTTDDMLAAVGEPRLPKGYNQVNGGFRQIAGRSTGPDSQPRKRGRF